MCTLSRACLVYVEQEDVHGNAECILSRVLEVCIRLDMTEQDDKRTVNSPFYVLDKMNTVLAS